MRSHPSSSHCLEVDDSPKPEHSSCPTVSSEASDLESPFIEKITTSSKSTWFSDATDLFVLLCSFLLITASIVLFALVLHSAINPASNPPGYLSILQRVVATFSVSITAAVMMVIGKRYVLFKLAKEGLRSRRVAIYSNPSIGNLASHLVLHGMELPLLGLSAVWGLALATSLTANDTWEYGPSSSWMAPPILSGPLNPGTASSSYVLAASEQLAIIMSSVCRWGEGSIGSSFIQVSSNASTVIYYPALSEDVWNGNTGFSYSTTMNGFNISMEQLPSIPSTAQNLTCTTRNSNDIATSTVELWFAGSDNQTLSIIIVDSSENPSIVRINATTLIVGGTLSSTGSYVEFALNGTSWPNVMTGTQWAQDITTIVCDATSPSGCGGQDLSLFEFARILNPLDANEVSSLWLYQIVSSALNMALGAYSSALLPYAFGTERIPITRYNTTFTTRYGIYVLAANIIVSIVMLIVALRLRLASPLGSDFINSTRLLLDPLRKPELFNASLDRTVQTLADPYMLVRDNNVFLLAEEKSAEHRRGWRNSFGPIQDREELELSIQSKD